MPNKKKIGIFMPGRLGSERLPNKLLLPLGRSNLWDIACNRLNQLPAKYNKYVLVYEPELIAIAEQYPNIKVIVRDEGTAKAEGPLSYIYKDVMGTDDTHLMFLNACFSLLSVDSLVGALETFETSAADYATSARPFNNWAFDESGKPITDIDYKTLSTKSIGNYRQAANVFHIFNRTKFLKDNMMLKPEMILIDLPESELIDVDTPEDYEFAKMKNAKRYVVDIDGTICSHSYPNHYDAKPNINRIKYINQLYEAGNYIIFLTARGSGSKINWRPITEAQLLSWGVKYNELHLSKPHGDYYIDDRAVVDFDFFKGVD